MDDQFIQSVKVLKEKGLSQQDMAVKLKVPRSQVQEALKKLKPPAETKTLVPVEDKLREIIREELNAARQKEEEGKKGEEDKDKLNGRFPVVRKSGGGEEMIAPEEVLRQYMGGTPEGDIELRAIMKFRAAMLMVMDLVAIQKSSAEADAKRMMPILSLMKETREEQDAAAARAKASSEDIADRAAQETAGHLIGTISQNNAQVGTSIEQIRQMLTGKKEDPFGRFMSMIQSMQQLTQMFGIPLPGMTAGAPQAGGQPQWETQAIERHSINELEGNDV